VESTGTGAPAGGSSAKDHRRPVAARHDLADGVHGLAMCLQQPCRIDVPPVTKRRLRVDQGQSRFDGNPFRVER